MKQLLCCFVAVIFSATTFSQTETDRIVNEGIKLYDEGKYEDVLKKYDSALLLNKNHYLANYEKSYTLLTIKQYDACIEVSKFLLEPDPKNSNTKGVCVNLGSALDDKGDEEEALKAFTKRIEQFPDFHLLSPALIRKMRQLKSG
jgi:tetratricopeptide (TPR) repeat protein